VKLCPYCRQRVRPTQTYVLNRNCIAYLIKIFALIKNSNPPKKYVETKETYRIRNSGSNTASNTQLKYLGALEQYYEGEDLDQKRSGKWKITDKGIMFIIGIGGLPAFVDVRNEDVIKQGVDTKIDDPSLKWFKHQDYWDIIKSDLKEAGIQLGT